MVAPCGLSSSLAGLFRDSRSTPRRGTGSRRGPPMADALRTSRGERVEMFDCGFETDSDLVGLQLSDVILWLMKRDFRPDQLEQLPQISSLLKTVLSSGYISEFSRIQLVEDTFHCLRVLESLPITSKQLKKGKSLQKKFERQRRQRITTSTLQ